MYKICPMRHNMTPLNTIGHRQNVPILYCSLMSTTMIKLLRLIWFDFPKPLKFLIYKVEIFIFLLFTSF